MATREDMGQMPLAIVGMACRLPGGVQSPSGLWELLEECKIAQSKFPATRFDVDKWYHPNSHRPGSVNASGGYFLSSGDSYRAFDPDFFGITWNEARTMDPQQRKLCEVAYECFESAGITLQDLSGSKTGCFIGNFTMDSAYDQWKDIENPQPYQTTGSSVTILSNRISYLFNMRGPSFTIDTACSSTMYALHYACQSVRSGDCSAAIVGGTNLIFGLEQHLGSVALGALSPTSTCHTFDESADGYGRADAVGALFIKPLSDAIRSGDPVRAIIRGTAVNTNGRSSGISHPSASQQESVIRAAYSSCNLALDVTGYIECHGTGTPVGDPIEVEAIGNVFASHHTPDNPLLLGSVKSNIGHGEAASAVASIIKTTLALERGEIPPTAGIRTMNPNLNLHGGSLKVCQSRTAWTGTYRRASVNSFGFGGANAHVILDATSSFLEELPAARPLSRSLRPASPTSRTEYLLPFSALNIASLQANIDAVGNVSSSTNLMELAFTLSARRTHFPVRAFLVRDEIDAVTAFSSTSANFASEKNKAPRVGFIFTGQSAQWAQMGLSLLDAFQVFQSTISSLDAALVKCSLPPEWSIQGVLRQPELCSKVHLADRSQTVCTAVQIALVDLLVSWNINPLAVVGHSSGEIAAAYAAGLISADAAIRIAYLRGIAVCTKQDPGAMLAVGLSVEEAESLISATEDIVVACHNSPRSVTLSGTSAAIDLVASICEERGIFARKLRTSGNAYHSWLMAKAGDEYQALLDREMSSAPNRILASSSAPPLMTSSVSGRILSPTISLSYWRQNLISQVQFARAVNTMLETDPNIDLLIEIGPHPALAGPIRDIVGKLGRDVSYLSTLTRNSTGITTMLELAGQLFLKRSAIDLAAVNGVAPGKNEHVNVLTDLPTYAWTYRDQDLLRSESRLCTDVKHRAYPRHDLLGSRLPGTSQTHQVWRNILRLEDVTWLRDHQIGDDIVFPGAGFVAIALEAARQTFTKSVTSSSGIILETMAIRTALLLPEGRPVEIITDSSLSSSKPVKMNFSIKSVDGGRWTEHATGVISPLPQSGSDPLQHPLSMEIHGGRWGVNSDSYSKMWFDVMHDVGLKYGPAFKILDDITTRTATLEGAATVLSGSTPSLMPHESAYAIHPTVLDAAFQLVAMAAHHGRPYEFSKPYVPTTIRNLVVELDRPVYYESPRLTVRAKQQNTRQISGTAIFGQEAGRLVFTVEVDLTSLESSFATKPTSSSLSPYNRLIWRPDFDHITTNQLLAVIPYNHDDVLVKLHFERLQEVCTLVIQNDCKRLPSVQQRTSLPFHLRKWVEWVEKTGTILTEGASSPSMTELRERRIEQVVEEFGDKIPELALVARLHNHFSKIVSGEANPLDIMVADGLLFRVYEQGFTAIGAYDNLAAVLQLIGHKNPSQRVLEVGSGSGGATLPALKALRGDTACPYYEDFVFTDVSTAFLSRAQEKFAAFKNVTYKILDIEKDPEEEGFVDQSFDLIIAFNVLHATASILHTLQHCKRLLKPEGRMVLVETTAIHLVTGLLVGQLPGYWLGTKDGRPDGPFMPVDEWHSRLQHAGFSGADHVLHDYSGPYHSTTVIVTQKPMSDDAMLLQRVDSVAASVEPPTVYLIYLHSPPKLAAHLDQEYKTRGIRLRPVSLYRLQSISERRIRAIVLLELEAPILFMASEKLLQGLQTLIRITTSAVWVSNAGTMLGKDPAKSLVMGFVRSIALEEPAFRVTTIDLDVETPETSPLAAAKLISDLEVSRSDDMNPDVDYNFVEKGGVLHISRTIADHEENHSFRDLYHLRITSDFCPKVSKGMFEKTGDLNSLYFDQVVAPTPGVKELLVQVSQFSLDPYTSAVLKGQKGWPFQPIECLGVVVAMGSEVSSYFVGQRVLCLGPDWIDTLAVVRQERCLPIGDGGEMTDREAQTHERQHHTPSPRPWSSLLPFRSIFQQRIQSDEKTTTSVVPPAEFFGSYKHLCLASHISHLIGSMSKKKVLIKTTPNGMLKYALAQIMMIAGAQVTVVAVSPQEHCALRAISKEISVLSGSEPLQQQLLDTSFDMVMVAEEDLCDNPDEIIERPTALRLGGELVLICDASTSVQDEKRSAFPPCTWGSIRLVNIAEMLTRDGDAVAGHMKRVYRLAATGELLPPARHTGYPISDIAAASETLEDDNVSHGTVGLVVSPSITVKVRQRPDFVSFRPDASYLLIGCLGGLGRVITMWMISRGARNLVFLSRSATDKPEAASLYEELLELSQEDIPGLRINVIRGDVAKREDVERAVNSCPLPIRGIIHAAMVKEEDLFDNMTLKTWNSVVLPKALGARHLHDCTLGMEIDFFVLTSTILSVVGAATGSNYSAANAYLDHFARHRHQQGLQATSISIGMVVNVGYVEEHQESEIVLRRSGMYGIDMEEFLHNLELACRTKNLRSSPPIDRYDPCAASTIITGMDPTRISSNSSKSIWQGDARFRHSRKALETHSGVPHPTQHGGGGGTVGAESSKIAALKSAIRQGEVPGRRALNMLITEKIANFLMVPVDQIEPSNPLAAYGMDSMIGSELRGWLSRTFQADVPFLALLDQNLTFEALADRVFDDMTLK